MHDLVRAGYLVSVPFGEDHRYDLIIERDAVFKSVQVKTGRLRNGVVMYNCYSSHAHRSGPRCRTYVGDVDYFGVFCPDNDSTYLIPLAEIPVQQGMLRIEPAENGQWRKLRWASRYLLFHGMGEVGKHTVDAVAAMAPEAPS
jgi:hypothetical protein